MIRGLIWADVKRWILELTLCEKSVWRASLKLMRNTESNVVGKYIFKKFCGSGVEQKKKKFCFPLRIYFPFGISFRETGIQI